METETTEPVEGEEVKTEEEVPAEDQTDDEPEPEQPVIPTE